MQFSVVRNVLTYLFEKNKQTDDTLVKGRATTEHMW